MGIGEAEARMFAAEGAKVIVADILGGDAETVAANIRAGGGEATAARIDVTSEAEWVGLIAKAVAAYGRLDILVNNAGISSSAVGDPDGLEGWHRLIAVNQTSVFLGTKLAAEQVAKTGGGSIVQHQLHHGICREDERPPRLSRIERRGADLLQGCRRAIRPVRHPGQHRATGGMCRRC
jgi:NAD(P)-dependent dehydrogenase (short-subunit alcohol dehydrogenase family)